MSTTEYDDEYAARQISRSRSRLRRLIKGFYLRNLVKYVRGPTIDFGCGAGQLLARLPPGSLGLEVNIALVKAVTSLGLYVKKYDPESDKLRFNDIPVGHFQTLVMSHVLEHFENAADSLRRIFHSCKRLGIDRVIIVVPGAKGYAFDKTHRTFIDKDYLSTHNLFECDGFSLTQLQYFPLDIEQIGAFFTFHELRAIYDSH